MKSSQDWHDGDLEPAAPVAKDKSDTDTPQTPLELSIESAGLSQGMSANPPRMPEEGGHEAIIVTVKEEDEIRRGESGDYECPGE